MSKIIHVYIFSRPKGMRKNFCFTSLAAVCETLSKDDIGVGYNYLLHAGLTYDGATLMTKKAIITRLSPISCKHKEKEAAD